MEGKLDFIDKCDQGKDGLEGLFNCQLNRRNLAKRSSLLIHSFRIFRSTALYYDQSFRFS
jgi:hypothetical protein